MKHGATDTDVRYVLRRAQSLGLTPHLSEHAGCTVIGVLGDMHSLDSESLGGLRGVEKVQSSTRPFRLASREFESRSTVVKVRDIAVGPDDVVVMAGPCSVESREQLFADARAVKETEGRLLWGGAFKPRSSPYSWAGAG